MANLSLISHLQCFVWSVSTDKPSVLRLRSHVTPQMRDCSAVEDIVLFFNIIIIDIIIIIFDIIIFLYGHVLLYKHHISQ